MNYIMQCVESEIMLLVFYVSIQLYNAFDRIIGNISFWWEWIFLSIIEKWIMQSDDNTVHATWAFPTWNAALSRVSKI